MPEQNQVDNDKILAAAYKIRMEKAMYDHPNGKEILGTLVKDEAIGTAFKNMTATYDKMNKMLKDGPSLDKPEYKTLKAQAEEQSKEFDKKLENAMDKLGIDPALASKKSEELRQALKYLYKNQEEGIYCKFTVAQQKLLDRYPEKDRNDNPVCKQCQALGRVLEDGRLKDASDLLPGMIANFKKDHPDAKDAITALLGLQGTLDNLTKPPIGDKQPHLPPIPKEIQRVR